MGAPKLENLNPLVDKRFMNAFVDGVQKTLGLMAQTQVKIGNPYIEKEFKSKGDVAGMVGMVAGNMKGTLTIGFTKEAVVEILKNMLGEEYKEINSEVIDAVGEMTNQVYGAAKTTLNQLGYSFEMAIPTVVQGKFVISRIHNGATLVLPFLTPENHELHVALTVQV